MRLIDADKLKYYGNHIGDEYEDRFHDFQYVDRDQIDKAPSIDIVRCGECKHNYNTAINHGKMQPRCDFTDYKLTENDFCSRGEREGE